MVGRKVLVFEPRAARREGHGQLQKRVRRLVCQPAVDRRDLFANRQRFGVGSGPDKRF